MHKAAGLLAADTLSDVRAYGATVKLPEDVVVGATMPPTILHNSAAWPALPDFSACMSVLISLPTCRTRSR